MNTSDRIQCRFCCQYPDEVDGTKCMWCAGYKAGRAAARNDRAARIEAAARGTIEAGESLWAAVWDGQLSRKGVTHDYATVATKEWQTARDALRRALEAP